MFFHLRYAQQHNTACVQRAHSGNLYRKIPMKKARNISRRCQSNKDAVRRSVENQTTLGEGKEYINCTCQQKSIFCGIECKNTSKVGSRPNINATSTTAINLELVLHGYVATKGHFSPFPYRMPPNQPSNDTRSTGHLYIHTCIYFWIIVRLMLNIQTIRRTIALTSNVKSIVLVPTTRLMTVLYSGTYILYRTAY